MEQPGPSSTAASAFSSTEMSVPIEVAKPMNTLQVAQLFGVGRIAVQKWIRSGGCPAPACRPHNRMFPRKWFAEDIERVREWLQRRRAPRATMLTTAEAARVLNCAKISLLRWKKEGCPVPQKPRGQRDRLWSACDLAAARRWLEQRRDHAAAGEGTIAQNALLEARAMYRCIGKIGR